MRPLSDYSPEVWDRFFDFIYDNAEPLTDAEVKERLAEAGIDMAPATERLRRLIESRRRKPD